MTPEQLSSKIRTIPDFPKKGIVFRDITTLLQDGEAFAAALEAMMAPIRGLKPDVIIGIESRGFIFGAALAHHAHKGLALARKPNKLPLASHREFYGLEYGQDSLEIQKSTLPNDARVLLLDDVLATGGTLIAADKLIRNAGFTVCGAITLLEIGALNGSAILNEHGISNKSVLTS